MYFGYNICIHIHIGTHTHSYILKMFLFHRLPFHSVNYIVTFLIDFHIRYELKAQLYSFAYPYLASPLLVLKVCLSPPWNICGTFVKNQLIINVDLLLDSIFCPTFLHVFFT